MIIGSISRSLPGLGKKIASIKLISYFAVLNPETVNVLQKLLQRSCNSIS